MYKWDLKEVCYKDGRPPFVPQRYGGVTLDAHGGIHWTDGCNFLSSHYRIEGKTFAIEPRVISTLMGCPGEREEVRYGEVT